MINNCILASFTIMRSKSKSGKFWRATGQSNLANRMKNCSTGQSALSSCVSTKTKLWKLLVRSVVCKPSLIIQWPARIFPLLATAHDCENGLLLRLYKVCLMFWWTSILLSFPFLSFRSKQSDINIWPAEMPVSYWSGSRVLRRHNLETSKNMAP